MWKAFVEAVGRHFGFLEAEFGFARKTMKPPVVVYESDKLMLLILFDSSRGQELDLIIRRLSDDLQKPLSLGIDTLMRFRDGPKACACCAAFPATEDALETEVKRLAELLKEYGSDLLRGDLSRFSRLEQEERERQV